MAMLYVEAQGFEKNGEKNGARPHFMDVIKNGEGTQGSKRGV